MWSETVFRDRTDAGRKLAARLGGYAGRDDVLVLALPRGGVPVGFEVARALGAPLDVMVVRKLGVPGHEEVAMGAVAGGGVRVLNREVVRMLRIPPRLIDEETRRERAEVERRERAYRGDRPAPAVRGRTVLLVDDGIATGSTVQAAVAALRTQGPARIVVATPTAPTSTCRTLRREVDEVVCLSTPEPFSATSLSYAEFPQLTDGQVREIIERADTLLPAGPRA
ncbi:MAG TPA: phosphoribosyltransferase [Longimicrobiaceae bacterium]